MIAKGEYYPPNARRMGIQGDTLVAFVIEPDGTIHHVTVMESSGEKVLDDAAVKFWGHVRFESPATLDGKPVRVTEITYARFHLR